MLRIFEKLDSKDASQKSILLFSLAWIIINLIQACFTELAHDEAYYWMYSQQLDWGYFDHPPMVALLIKIGYSLFNNELGVRFLFVIMGGITLYNIYQLIEVKKIWLFISCSVTIILVNTHFAGFFALPDIPLIFFATIFFRLYKKFLLKETLTTVILLGLVISAMFYSKYHGVLIVFFTFISNLKLIRSRNFYAIILVVLVCMLPHLFWQINNHFPTFNYHLVGRSQSYKLDNTLNYLYSIVLVAGPLVSWFLIYATYKYKPKNDFTKSLKYNFWGFYIFFFLMSFKGRVEAHWLAAAIIPLIILGVKYINDNQKIKRIVYALLIPTIIIFIAIRIVLISDKIIDKFGLITELHHWDEWAKEIDSVSQGYPVVFINKFQYPSKYTFYTGKFATTLNAYNYRKNQFDIWDFEDSIQNKTILLTHTKTPTDSIITSLGNKIRYEFIEDFTSYFNSVRIIPMLVDNNLTPNDSIAYTLAIINQSDKIIDFKKDKQSNQLSCNIFLKDIKHPIKKYWPLNDSIHPGDTVYRNVILNPLGKPGDYDIIFSIKTEKLLPADNRGITKISVEK